MGGGKDKQHETADRGLFSFAYDGGQYPQPQSYPPQGYGHGYPPQAHHGYPSQGGYPPHGYPSSGGYPPVAYPSGYPPVGYPPSSVPHHSGYGSNMGTGGLLGGGAAAAAYGLNHLMHGGQRPGYGGYGGHHGYSHGGSYGYGGGYGHGKLKHGKFKGHGGKYGRPFGGKFKKWK